MEDAVIFDDGTMIELAKIARLEDDERIADFQKDLEFIGSKYAHIISTVPCDLPGSPYEENISLTQRGKWLDNEVLKPATKLLAALENDKVPMFSDWPYPIKGVKFPDRDELLSTLQDLLDYSQILRRDLRGQQKGNESHNQEIRQEIFTDVVLVMREHIQELTISRGVYDANCHKYVGQYVDIARFIFRRISGVADQLDRLIKEEIRNPS